MATEDGATQRPPGSELPPVRVAGRRRGWYRGDCHVHTQRSHGGELTAEQIAVGARQAGLDFIAITEHNTTDTHGAWGSLAGDDLLVILGQEVVTDTGHWLALGIEPGHVVDWRYGVRDNLVDHVVGQVHEAGGMCVAAHPHAPYPSGAFMYPFLRFDAVEVWNGRWNSDLPWQADNEAALAEWGRALAAAVQHGPWHPAIGNSDVHLEGQIGSPHTVVLADELSTDAVLAGLRAGQSWIAESAEVDLSFTVDAGDRSAGIGERLKPADEPTAARVEVKGVPSGAVSLHTDRGRTHRELLADDGTGSLRFPISRDAAAFVRVEVRHPTGHMAALTNPIILI